MRLAMTADVAQRWEKLAVLLDRLKQNKIVQNRDLRTWLTEDEYSSYVAECASQSALRDEIADKPAEVVEYEKRIKKAQFAYNKAERNSQRGKRSVAGKGFNRADTLFERALEYLQEIIAADQYLQVWFDRDTAWTADGSINIDPVGVPRVVTSKSVDAQGGGLLMRKQGKRELKIDAVERALSDLTQPELTEDELEQAQRLDDALIERLRKRSGRR